MIQAPAIHKEVLRDKIFEVLKTWILDGTLKPGERIVEYTLASRLNVSRAPLREALWLLSNRGLVTIKAHHGTFVTQLSEQDILDIFEVREALETCAARKIRASLTPEKRDQLRKAMAELENAGQERDMARFSDADHAFHGALAALCENRHIEGALRDLSARFFGYELIRDVPHAEIFRFDDMVRDHRRMIELILKGDERAIDEGYRAIFAGFREHLLERFRSHQERPRENP